MIGEPDIIYWDDEAQKEKLIRDLDDSRLKRLILCYVEGVRMSAYGNLTAMIVHASFSMSRDCSS